MASRVWRLYAWLFFRFAASAYRYGKDCAGRVASHQSTNEIDSVQFPFFLVCVLTLTVDCFRCAVVLHGVSGNAGRSGVPRQSPIWMMVMVPRQASLSLYKLKLESLCGCIALCRWDSIRQEPPLLGLTGTRSPSRRPLSFEIDIYSATAAQSRPKTRKADLSL